MISPYSFLKLSKRACKSASASDIGVVAPAPPPPATAAPPPAPAPIAAACGVFEPATDNDAPV